MDTKSKPTSRAPEKLALAGSLLLHVGLIALASYWQWDMDSPRKSRQQVVKIKFLPSEKADQSIQKPATTKAEHFSAIHPVTSSSPPIRTLQARTPELSTPAHQPVPWTKQARPSEIKHIKSRRPQPVFNTDTRPPVHKPLETPQPSQASQKIFALRPISNSQARQLNSIQAAIPLNIQQTGILKIARRGISIRQTERPNTVPTGPQTAFLMKVSGSESKSLHQRPVPDAENPGNDSAIQPPVAPFTSHEEPRTEVAAILRELQNSPPKAPDNSTPSNIDTRKARGLFTGQVRQRIANAKFYPRIARRRGIEGQPVVAFTLDRGGRLMKANLEKTSGYQVLDQAALEAVQEAAPYPEIPAELNTETFQFKLPISFILK